MKPKRKRKPKPRKPMPKPSRPMTSRNRRRMLDKLFDAIWDAKYYE